jgi:nucleoside-diphosphate-sugar epimerase
LWTCVRRTLAKARDALGWTPGTPIKEGLVRTLGYFESLPTEEGVRAVVGSER